MLYVRSDFGSAPRCGHRARIVMRNSLLLVTRRAQQVVILAKFGPRRETTELLQFTRDGEDEMLHANLASGLGGKKRGSERDVADVAAGQFELAREESKVDVCG